MGAERQLELACDFRPVLAKHVPCHVIGDTIADAAGGGAKAPWVSGMIKIAQRFRAYGRKPLRIIRHELAGITLRNKPVRQRVAKARLRGALSQTVVTRVLAEESGIKKDAEEVAGGVICDRSAEPFSISCGAHLVAGIVAINLRGCSVPGCANVVQRIRSAFHEHVKFI